MINSIGNHQTVALIKMQNSRNVRPNVNTASTNGRQTQFQPRPCLVVATGVTAPNPSSWGRNHSGDGLLLSTGLSKETLEWRQNFHDPVFRANHWLNGLDREGWEEPFGTQVFINILRESDIEIPENSRFDISVDRYGGVTITGLNDADLTRAIEEALSYDALTVITVLAQFMEHARVLDGHPPSRTSAGLSAEQQDLFSVQSQLNNFGVDLRNLSLGENGRIQGLPQELYDLLYGDRSSHLEGLNRYQIQYENYRLNWLRDNALRFLRSETTHIPSPNISLTFNNGRMVVNGVTAFNPNNSGGINVTI